MYRKSITYHHHTYMAILYSHNLLAFTQSFDDSTVVIQQLSAGSIPSHIPHATRHTPQAISHTSQINSTPDTVHHPAIPRPSRPDLIPIGQLGISASKKTPTCRYRLVKLHRNCFAGILEIFVRKDCDFVLRRVFRKVIVPKHTQRAWPRRARSRITEQKISRWLCTYLTSRHRTGIPPLRFLV